MLGACQAILFKTEKAEGGVVIPRPAWPNGAKGASDACDDAMHLGGLGDHLARVGPKRGRLSMQRICGTYLIWSRGHPQTPGGGWLGGMWRPDVGERRQPGRRRRPGLSILCSMPGMAGRAHEACLLMTGGCRAHGPTPSRRDDVEEQAADRPIRARGRSGETLDGNAERCLRVSRRPRHWRAAVLWQGKYLLNRRATPVPAEVQPDSAGSVRQASQAYPIRRASRCRRNQNVRPTTA